MGVHKKLHPPILNLHYAPVDIMHFKPNTDLNNNPSQEKIKRNCFYAK